MANLLKGLGARQVRELQLALEKGAVPGRVLDDAHILVIDLQQLPCVVRVELDVLLPGKEAPFHAKGILRWYNDELDASALQGMGIEILEFRPAKPDAMQAASPAAARTPGPDGVQETARPVAPDAGHGAKAGSVPSLTPEKLGDVLSGLLGIEVKVRPCDAWVAEPNTLLASYAIASGDIGAWAACNREWVCFAGAALTMVPVTAAMEGLKSPEIATFLENANEILNVLSSILNTGASPHLKLAKTAEYQAESQAFDRFCSQGAARVNFEVDIPGYGTGKMSLWL